MSLGDKPPSSPRPAKNRAWETAYLRFKDDVLRQIRGLRGAQAGFLKGKLDSEEILVSALDSFASWCAAHDPEGQRLDDFRDLLACIAFRKFCGQVNYWRADRRDAARTVSAAQLAPTVDGGEAWQPTDPEPSVTEAALLDEAWQQTVDTVEELKRRFRQELPQAAADKAARIVELLFETMHDPVARKVIREQADCTEYFLDDIVMPQLRAWLAELYPEQVKEIDRARTRARAKNKPQTPSAPAPEERPDVPPS